jgi:hypothetical protein
MDLLSNTVDLIEINHCYDENGQLVFDQLLYYDWCPKQQRYNVRDWRLLKRPIQLPRRNPQSGMYVAIWRDGPVMREVHAKTIRESWTQYDPEIVEQEFLAKDKRRALPKFTQRRARATAGRRPTASRGTPSAPVPAIR